MLRVPFAAERDCCLHLIAIDRIASLKVHDYIADGAGAQPPIVGYQNQLIEWVLQDAGRWKRVAAHALAKPVILYPRPTVFSARLLISIHREADELIDVLTNESRARTRLGGL